MFGRCVSIPLPWLRAFVVGSGSSRALTSSTSCEVQWAVVKSRSTFSVDAGILKVIVE